MKATLMIDQQRDGNNTLDERQSNRSMVFDMVFITGSHAAEQRQS